MRDWKVARAWLARELTAPEGRHLATARAGRSVAPKLAEEPGAGKRPVAHHRLARHPQDFGGLFDAQASKEPEFDDLAAAGIEFRKSLQRFVERDQILAALRRRQTCTPTAS